MTKTIDKRRSIGLASRELGLESHVLRFWEKEFSQLKPNVGKGGRRYYYDKDIENFKKIKYFLYNQGYTIKGLQKLLASNKNLLGKDLEDIKKTEKFVDSSDINSEKVTENVNELIAISVRIEELLEKI